MADVGDVLMSVLSTIRVPKSGDRVHKDECALSFASPESEGGLFVCMNTFLGFGSQYVDRHYARTGQRAYLQITRTRKPKSEDDSNSAAGHPPKKKPTRLAIGIEGGFDVDQDQYEEDIKVVILPDRQEVTSDDLTTMTEVVKERVSLSMAGIMAADSVSHTLQVQQWDGEVRQESKHAADLKQLDNGVKIPPSGWRCEVCDLQENIWMNLTDGKVLCGRRYFDGTGGNNHALLHFKETGYPLAVKLGTITPDGAGTDVYSYDEDDMVLDSKLAEHLSHFGIDMMTMEKTERTMTELEIAVNQRVGEWEVIQESGTTLRPLFGPGLTGMKNLGNSCYLNSVMQVLFTVPDFQGKYVSNIDKIIDEAPSDPSQDFKTQVAKLGYGLLSGEYAKPAPDTGDENCASEPRGDQIGIAPRMFKALVGRGHPEFSTNRQQDAQEFLLHFINMVERNCRSGQNPSESFRFLVEEKIMCEQSQKAKYTQRVDYIVQLPVPMDQATNTEELQEAERRREMGDASTVVRAQIPFTSCMAALTEPEVLTDFWSSAVQAKTTATKTMRFASFPDYLVIQIKKFTFGLDWVPKKLDVSIDVPDTLDLSALRATGQLPGEELLPEVAPPPLMTPDVEVKAPVLDDSTVSQLCEMGFPLEACRKAVYYTGNSGIDAAMNWVMTHMDDPDFASPLVLPGSSGAGNTPTESLCEEHLATIISMGFSRDQATKALRATSNVLDRAVDWIFSHVDDLESMDVSEGRSAAESEGAREPPPGPRVRDGPGKYELFAFVSHMGTSTMCGHYVCHIKKDQQWVIFNDQKVCASEKPPKDLGYLYFYRRVAD
ncbi:ubiquitin carboxyl-terminal hydrolase 5 isoform X3 [Eucyclogobius newberryi]|uniref:ubiquitin carboxyl-terminal hydrolase 5 isoform X3 n=1 Tax=Eucyclogobius newberryi TaxID=166745 RepID=UPI003B5B639A